MAISRRAVLKAGAMGAMGVASGARPVGGQAPPTVSLDPTDRVFICNEDSNTLSVIDPNTNAVDATVNLTSFDEDPRPPFRFVTGGVMPTHAAMIAKPLYHGAIHLHGAAPSPDGRLIATTGRGSSNVYLVDTAGRRLVGNVPNPQASATTNRNHITTGILVGREPHEPTFTRNGKELWVTVRGEDRIAIVDVAAALRDTSRSPTGGVRRTFPTLNGPAQVWFSRDGALAFIVSQKVSTVEVWNVNADTSGHSNPVRKTVIDISAQDAPGFTPFLKTSPDGAEVWLSHKLADRVSALGAQEPFGVVDAVPLGAMARPNHVEFVENTRGKVVYVSLARVDDGGPGGVASSQIAIIDRSAPPGQRRVVGTFFSHGREAHGLWTNPTHTLLYIAHEQDALPGTPNAGQTVASAFDVGDPSTPRFIAQVPLGFLELPSGRLRNKKSINLVYVRPGVRSQTA
jgi:YVTN family beta-propeller protein